MEPLVSIGLCVFNGTRYLKESLDSLLSQSYANFEMIISDNASTDKTQQICEEYARRDKRIRYIRQKENIGSFSNYDFVRRESRGDYFMYTSDDDIWHPDFIKKCLAKFKEEPGALVVFPNFCTFDDSGRVMKYNSLQYFPFQKNCYQRLKTYILSRGQYGKSTIIYGFWRKKTLADQVLLDEYKSDMFYIFKTLSLGYFAAIPEILLFKRLPVQFEKDKEKSVASFRYLTSLPNDFKYERVEDWLRTRKESVRGRGIIKTLKEFIADRIQAAKYSYLYAKYIFRIFDLSRKEKMKLMFWNFYAYLCSLWYGHV